MQDTPPAKVGKYQLTDLLGQGAMGVVYRALDPLLNRHVAIKLMSQGIAADAELRSRFLREAQAAGSLQHPNIITIYDFGEAEGHLYIAMEYIEGADLSEIIDRRDPLPLPAKLDIMIDVLHALHYAHGRRMVHRDIKPANIRVAVDGRAKLMDFGIARLESSSLTKSGMLIGTPNYMAPEQVTSGQVTPATDVFAMGVVLYEFLTYRRTFAGDTLHAVLYQVVSEQPPPMREVARGIPEPLQPIVEKALAKEPAARYQTAGSMAQEIAAVRTTLSGGGATVAMSSRITKPMTATGRARRPKRLAVRAGVAAGGALVLGAAIWLAVSARGGRSAGPATSPTAAPATGTPTPSGTTPPAGPAPTALGRSREQAPASRTRVADTLAHSAPAVGEPRREAAAAASPAPPAPAAAPQAAPPAAPSPSAPAPAEPAPATDPRADIEQLVAAYARAIGSRSVAEIRRVYPGLTGSQQQGWEQFFQSMRSVQARLAITRLDVSGASADLTVSGSYDYDAGGGRAEHQPVSFRATAALEGGAWRLRTIR